MSESAWVVLGSVALGALLSGGTTWLNSHKQHRHQEEQDRRKLYREKLEELYQAISQFKQSYIETTSSQISTLAARLPFENFGPSLPIEKTADAC